MLNTNKNPKNILDVLISRGHNEEDISAMSPENAFDEYCNWHGLNGLGSTLRKTLASLDSAENIKE